MVNKAAVGILGVIVVASLGVGILVGMQLAGTDAAQMPADSNSTNGEQAGDAQNESSATGSESNETAANETTATATEQHTSIPARQFDDGEIADHIVRFVNEERAEHDRQQLSSDTSTARSVQRMANNHSVQMANAGEFAHDIDGVGTVERYETNGLSDRCKVDVADKDSIRHPDERFESIGFTYAGQTYQQDGNTTFNEDERAVARAIVDDWMNDDEYRDRILMVEPTLIGVGVEVTSDGDVYATANVCA